MEFFFKICYKKKKKTWLEVVLPNYFFSPYQHINIFRFLRQFLFFEQDLFIRPEFPHCLGSLWMRCAFRGEFSPFTFQNVAMTHLLKLGE